eukprot:134798_1
MSPQWNDGTRARMHLLNILPTNCYKCMICGLCGSFNIANGNMPNCYGNDLPFSGGYSKAYDPNGWTWETNYVEQNCDRTQPPPTNPPDVIYTPDECTIDCNPCSNSIHSFIQYETS